MEQQTTDQRHLLYLTALCLLVLGSGASVAQGTNTTIRKGPGKLVFGPSATPVPLNHLYWHFFVYQEHLDTVAAQKEKEGQDGRWLRDHFEQELHFSSSDFAIVRITAGLVVAELAQLDSKAAAIIASDRVALKANAVPLGGNPPGFERLKLLTLDREELFRTHIALMNEKLGPVKAEALANYLTQVFASHVQGGTLSPASSGASPAAKTGMVSK